MSEQKLYCVDCYVPNQLPLAKKCLERCDSNGPVEDADGIARMRKIRASLSPEGTHCSECNKGLLRYPNAWWKNQLHLLRCDWCGSEYRVHENSPIILSKKTVPEGKSR